MNWQLFSPLILSDKDLRDQQQRWLMRAKDLMPNVHENRRHEWANGRVALSEAFRARGVPLDLLTCEFMGHQKIKQLPEWRFSLSNTHGFAAALVVPATGVTGIGLDIELSNRQVPTGVSERAHNESDVPGLRPIEVWSAKEAIYKCLGEVIQGKIWLNNIVLQEHSFWLDKFPHVRGEWRLQAHSQLAVVMAQTNSSAEN